MRAWRIALLAWAVLVCGMSGLRTSPAWAHATLVSSDPGDGSTIAASPANLVLRFNEPVSALVLRLSGPDGEAKALPVGQDRTERLSVALPVPLARGTHALSWRVVSLDGHPVGGTLVFSIGEASGGALHAALPSVATAWLIWTARVVLYAACCVSIGGFAFTCWVSRRPIGEEGMVASASLGIAAAIFSVGLQGLDALGLGLADIAAWAPWRAGLATSFGLTAGLAVVGLGATLIGLRTRSFAARRSSAWVASSALALAFAASGHASAASPTSLMRPVVAAHVLAVAAWIGALVPLGLALREGRGAASLARFSRAAPVVVGLLVLSGAVLTTVQLRDPSDLIGTAYGRILLAKIALVLALLLLAAWNRWWTTQPALRGEAPAMLHLRRAILAEAVLALAILCLVAGWRFTPPPRALLERVSVHIHTPRAMADITITPDRAGSVTMDIDLMTGEAGRFDAADVTVAFSNAAAGFEPLVRPAARSGSTWRVVGLPVPADGRWQIRLDVLVDDFDRMTLDGEVDIRRR